MGHLHRGKLLMMARARDAALEAGATREEAKAVAYDCMAPSSARAAAERASAKPARAPRGRANTKARKGGKRRGAKKA